MSSEASAPSSPERTHSSSRPAEPPRSLCDPEVRRAEVVAPLRDAVGLVDGDERRLALAQHLGEAGDAQPFRRDKEEVEIAAEVVHASLPRECAIKAGVNARDREAERGEARCLIVHERDERADDERGPAARDGGELVAEGFAGTGRHHQQNVFAFGGSAANGFLIGAEGGVAEVADEKVRKRRGGMDCSVGHGFALPWSHAGEGGSTRSRGEGGTALLFSACAGESLAEVRPHTLGPA